MLAVSVVFGVVIGKEVFGGTGMNILNPALTIRAFLFFAYPTWMSGDKVWVHDAVNRAGTPEAISGETILGSYAQNQDIIYSLSDMFYGFIPGSVGETSKLLIVFGALFLYRFTSFLASSNGQAFEVFAISCKLVIICPSNVIYY